MTFPLLTNASGIKMGKTHAGAVWLDGEMTSPYDFYQYWINCDDRDVGRFLRLYTFLPLDEIRRLEALEGSERRAAKQTLAFEAARITHGDRAAGEARATAAAAFGGGSGRDLDAMPSTVISRDRLQAGISPQELFTETGLTASRGEAKRLIKQGGLYVNDRRVDNGDRKIGESDITPEGILLRAGKKKYHRVRIE